MSKADQQETILETSITDAFKEDSEHDIGITDKDIQEIEILRPLRRHCDNQTAAIVYIIRLNLWWQLFNFMCFILLKLLLWAFSTAI